MEVEVEELEEKEKGTKYLLHPGEKVAINTAAIKVIHMEENKVEE